LACDEVAITSCRRGACTAQDRLTFEEAVGAVVLPPPARRLLLEAALALDLTEVAVREADRPVLDQLVEQMVRDLLVRLAVTREEETHARRVSVTLGLQDRELLTLELPENGVVRLIHAALPRRPDAGPLVSRRRALGVSPVTVEGLLGRGSLSIHDLEGLAVGDIVLLDRGPSEKVELRLAPRSYGIAHAVLGRTGDRPSLRL
jgi:hypothetical protein